MKVKDFNDYRAPTRRPWLYFLLAAAVLTVAGSRVRCSCRSRRPPRSSEATVARKPAGRSPEVARAVGTTGLPVTTQASRARLAEIDALIAADQLAAARDALFEVLDETVAVNDPFRSAIEARLGRIHIALVMTPRTMPEKTDYVIRSGDSLERIANRFGTTAELLQVSNNIRNPNRIRIGDRLRVLNARFAIAADTARHDLVVTLDGRFFKRYRTGTGKYGSTPTGTFDIRQKIAEPTWWRPDGREFPFGHPENILGTRWMAIRATGDTEPVRGYGIHGTWDDASIGSASSAGCLRMHNADVEELFTYIPVGTPVVIR